MDKKNAPRRSRANLQRGWRGFRLQRYNNDNSKDNENVFFIKNYIIDNQQLVYFLTKIISSIAICAKNNGKIRGKIYPQSGIKMGVFNASSFR